MKKIYVFLLVVFLFSCKQDGKNISKENDGDDGLKYDMVSVIEKGNTKVVVGSKTPHATDGQIPTFGVFPEGRTVTLSSFQIGKYEVNYKLWYEVRTKAEKMGYVFANKGMQGHETKGGAYPEYVAIGNAPTPPSAGTRDSDFSNEKHPVTMISWRDAIIWCNAYSEMKGLPPVYYYKKDGQEEIIKDAKAKKGSPPFMYCYVDMVYIKDNGGYRLPTEAEWEMAARGGNSLLTDVWNYKYSGGNTMETVAWMEINSQERTHECGMKSSNTLEIFDMTGNVDEWCFDIYNEKCDHSDEAYKVLGIVTDPQGMKLPNNSDDQAYWNIKRCYRGGKFDAENDYGLVSLRKNAEGYIRNNGLGLRLARSLK